MRILWKYIVKGIALAFFASCVNPGSTGLSSTDAHKILESKQEKNDTLEFWDIRTPLSKQFLTGVYKNGNQARISIYIRNDVGNWVSAHSETFADVAELHKTEWTQVNRQSYLYFEYTAADTAEGKKRENKKRVVFSLYQPMIGRLFRLGYEYARNGVQGNFVPKNSDSLAQHPLELGFLQKRAGLSGLIPAEDKKNTRPGADSALKKWAMLNEGVYDALKDKTVKTVQLNIEEYSSDISPGPEEFDNDTLVYKLNTLVSQNAQYKAVSEVKGPVYILNKGSGKSFIIWAPPESKSWIHKMAFRSGGLLMIYPSVADSAIQGVQVFELNLVQKTIRPVIQHVKVAQTKKSKRIKTIISRPKARKKVSARRAVKKAMKRKHHKKHR